MLALSLASLALPLVALAQGDYGPVAAAPASTMDAGMDHGSASATGTHSASSAAASVFVGGGSLTFTPSTVNVPVGGQVHFYFRTFNHTLTQSSSFAAPCANMVGGIDTGFKPVANNSIDPLPHYVMTINDTNPVYFHCKQGNHCAGGMVFIANPAAASPIEQFVLNAKGASGTSAMASGAATGTAVGSAASAAVTSARSSATKTVGGVAGAVMAVLGAFAFLA